MISQLCYIVKLNKIQQVLKNTHLKNWTTKTH